MTDQRQATSQDFATQVRELTPAELEQVDGGSGANVLLGDGSVRYVSAGDPKWLTHLDRTL